MKIIAGAFRGREIASPPLSVRPIPVLLRKSLFDILGDRIQGCRFLDGFAGSGIVGIEALSRGAALVDFVDSDGSVLALLRKNLERLGAREQARLHEDDFRAFLRTSSATWDIVFVDPPYGAGPEREWLSDPGVSARLAPAGLVILKAPARWKGGAGGLALRRVKAKGENALFFYGAS